MSQDTQTQPDSIGYLKATKIAQSPVLRMIGSVAAALAGAALVGYCGGQLVSSLRPVSEKVLEKVT